MIRTIKIHLCKPLIKKVESTCMLSPLPPESLTKKKDTMPQGKKRSQWVGDGKTFWKRGNEGELLMRKSSNYGLMAAEGTPHINQCALSPRKDSRLRGTETNHQGQGRAGGGEREKAVVVSGCQYMGHLDPQDTWISPGSLLNRAFLSVKEPARSRDFQVLTSDLHVRIKW